MADVIHMTLKSPNAPVLPHFPNGVREMLLAIPYARPGWEVMFGQCDEGDEWAVVTDEADTSVFGVDPTPSGAMRLHRDQFETVGIFGDVGALRAALMDLIDNHDPEAAREAYRAANLAVLREVFGAAVGASVTA